MPEPRSRFPVVTERLTLRHHRAGDAVPLGAIYARPDVARHLLDEPWTATDASEKVAARLTRTGLDTEQRQLALVIEHADTVIGDVALWTPEGDDPRTAEIGWVLDPDHGGRGLATEAVRAVLGLAFDVHDLHRVTAQMDGRNAASARLAERVGMRREAHLRQNWWSKGEWTDTLTFAVLAADR